MKKIIPLVAASVLVAANIAKADEGFQTKLNGQYNFQAGYSRDNQKKENKNLSANHKDFAFNSMANVVLDASNKLESGFTYGAKINLKLSSKNVRNNASYLYTQSDEAGKWEFGSGKSAYSTMKVAGTTFACGSQLWDVWVTPDAQKNVSYVTSFANFLDPKTRSADQEEYSRKITYYSPKLIGFQLGASYVPDSSNTGYGAYSNDTYHNMARLKTATGSDYKSAIKDGVALGLTYEKKLADNDASFKASITGERGKITQPRDVKQEKLKNLQTYTLGVEYEYKKFSVTAGHMNYMKSLTSSVTNPIGRDTQLYTVTGRYAFDNAIRASATHFNSNHHKNKLDATTVGFDYVGMKGIRPYAEITYYEAKGKYKDKQGDIVKQSNKGTVLLLGTKINC